MSLPPSFPALSPDRDVNVLVVCLGNICRSPTFEGVFRALAAQKGLSGLEIDSAGTSNYHIGETPHPPSIRHAKARGYDISCLRARQYTSQDAKDFDLILAADTSNHRNILSITPKELHPKVRMVSDYLPKTSAFFGATSIPDPWGGDADDYEQVINMCEDAANGLLDLIAKNNQEKE